MLSINIKDLSPTEIQNHLQYAVAPRPICLASTIDKNGQVNLSPFSFFNLFSTNPPICIFSPSRRVRDNSVKHTLENVMQVPECVINIVDYNIVQQMSLSSTEYPKHINEFEKAGFTMIDSLTIKPPRVAESPIQLECKVNKIIPLGDQNGAGNLILAEIKYIHIKEEILDEDGKIDQQKLELVARLGGDWYSKITTDNLFKINKPIKNMGIGIDSLPEEIKKSIILNGNELAQLGNQEKLPSKKLKTITSDYPALNQIQNDLNLKHKEKEEAIHHIAKKLIAKNQSKKALEILTAT